MGISTLGKQNAVTSKEPEGSIDDASEKVEDRAERELSMDSNDPGIAPSDCNSSECSTLHSIGYSQSDVASRSNASDVIQDIKCDVMAHWLRTRQEERMWVDDKPGEGVFVKRSKGNYSCAPLGLVSDQTGLYEAVTELNVKCAMTVSSTVISYVLRRVELPYVQIQAGLRLQVVPDFYALAHCQRGQSAAFVVAHQVLIVWQDDPKLLLKRAQAIQEALTRTLVGIDFDEEGQGHACKTPFSDVAGYSDYDSSFETENCDKEYPRQANLWQAVYTGISIFLLTVAIGHGWRQIAIEHVEDPNWFRLLFIICVPAQFWLSLFFFQAVVGNVAQITGSADGLKRNSKYYSGKPPRRLHRDTYGTSLPHVTIQMPVFKEGLRGVIEPTVRSIKQAISTYELQGGTANIFVNDDGMQLLSIEEARERQDFYDENRIGWVARPGHNTSSERSKKRYLRRGKFKKASNMNFALRLSVQVEEYLAKINRGGDWTQNEENAVYLNALHTAVAEGEGEAWADGSIRIGDYILLIDSDTRVPNDCLLEAVSEMEQCPQVAILQYSSGVMNVTNNFFEKGISFFTKMIYTMICFAVSNGDVAPFVGHNAILRWSALQEVAYECGIDHWEKYWSESTVSEDFDMALRLQSEGYIVRLAAYKNDGYKEGVSLTVYDELARWEKYAFGCNELMFHPFRDWIFRGPFTKLFMTFMFSNMPLPSKFTIMAYIGTYYALGSAWILTMLNYFLVGFFNGYLDHYYLHSFRVYFAIIVVFTGIGNLSLAWIRYRVGQGGLFKGIIENFKWVPVFIIFLGGVSLHISQAIFCHFFSIDMEWGATTKEEEKVSFAEAMRNVIRKFKWSFLFCFLVTGLMLYCRFGLQEDWQIKLLVAIWPMGAVVVNHFLLPIVLNPELMRLTW
ncbi:glycosyl transferase family group 2-domain-containing protein [Pyrenochaeta sp. MPI-SDFR-AT-0127]|nr:glycosyl transferase family group 2-domain-containing protein [Pyrenochaeta sp. MPI-SDFR-AT-0127]